MGGVVVVVVVELTTCSYSFLEMLSINSNPLNVPPN